jgi:hypothetical protein
MMDAEVNLPTHDAVIRPNGFAARCARLLETKLDCRRLVTEEEREPVYRLRYDCYRREGGVDTSGAKLLTDEHDHAPHGFVFGFYVDDQLVGSQRIHVISKEFPASPQTEVFPDLLEPELEAGMTAIDCSRFVIDHEFGRRYRELPYLVTRIAFLACDWFGTEYAMTAARPEHWAFYKRTYAMLPVCEPRSFPRLTAKFSLVRANYQSDIRPYTTTRYPFYNSTYTERKLCFEPNPVTVVQKAMRRIHSVAAE